MNEIMIQVNKILPYFRKIEDSKKFKNILVVSNTGLGDTILGTPAIKTLRKSFPDIKITFLIHKKMYPLFSNFKYVDDFILYSRGLLSQLKLIKKLRNKKIDTIFLLHSNGPEDIFFSLLSRADTVLKVTDDKNHIFKNEPINKKQHIIESKLDIIRLYNPKDIDKKLEIPYPCHNNSSSYISKNKLSIGFQIGAQDIYKVWPIKKFIKLAQKIIDDYDCNIVILGSTKFEIKQAEKLVQKLNSSNIINKCGCSTIEKLPNLLNEIDLLITNDTGTLHLAVALKIPTISLFGPTDSKIYGPYQDFNIHDVIQKDGFFVNSIAKKHRNQDGINLIKVEEVFNIFQNKMREIND